MNKNQDKSKQIKKKHAGGRPLKYTEREMIKVGQDLIEWLNESEEHLFVIEFLAKKGLYWEIIERWEKRSEEFCRLYKKAKFIQEMRLLKKGVKGGNSTAFTIFLLKNFYGYQDRQNIDMRQERIIKVEGEDAKLIKKMLKDVKNNAKSVGKNE